MNHRVEVDRTPFHLREGCFLKRNGAFETIKVFHVPSFLRGRSVVAASASVAEQSVRSVEKSGAKGWNIMLILLFFSQLFVACLLIHRLAPSDMKLLLLYLETVRSFFLGILVLVSVFFLKLK